MSEIAVNIADALEELEARVTFLADAAGALSSLADAEAFPQSQSWLGLCFFTRDIETALRQLNKQASA